jgi:hypothetical protein
MRIFELIRYHWCLFIAPKVQHENTTGTRFHAKTIVVLPLIPTTTRTTTTTKPQTTNTIRTWQFEEQPSCPVTATANALLARVLIAKLVDTQAVMDMLRNVPVVQGREDWNCVAWVRDAIAALRGAEKRVLGNKTAVRLEWGKVRDGVMGFMDEKRRQRRWDGSQAWGECNVLWPATFDLIVGKESIA